MDGSEGRVLQEAARRRQVRRRDSKVGGGEDFEARAEGEGEG